MSTPAVPALDLARPRDLGELITATVVTLGRHLSVFLTMTAIVVVPVLFFVDGLWGGRLADGSDADPALGAQIASIAITAVVLPGIVTALHVRAVQALGRGERPTVGATMGAAAPRLGAAVSAVTLQVAAVAVGFLCLIVPGVWLMVRLTFAAQAAVVDEEPPTGALRRSAELVDGQWWRVLGIVVVLAILEAVLGGVLGAIADVVSNGPASLALELAGTTIGLSVQALGTTLLFFDLRARAGGALASGGPGEAVPPAPAAPEETVGDTGFLPPSAGN